MRTIEKDPIPPEAWRSFSTERIAEVLNSDSDYRRLFREAVEETKTGIPEDEAAAGLAALFGGQ